jgi:hypothetical protein
MIDFSDLETGDAFDGVASQVEDSAPPIEGKDSETDANVFVSELLPSPEEIVMNGAVSREDNLEEEIGDIISGVELKEEDFKTDIILEEPKFEKGQKSPADQIKEWEKLLLID